MTIYLKVHYCIRDGECDYGHNEYVKAIDGDLLSRDELQAQLLTELANMCFGENDEDDVWWEKEEDNYVMESSGCRALKLSSYDKIPKEDFEVLDKYEGSTTITCIAKAKVTFT